MSDIKLVPTQQLINEVLSRFDHALIVVKKIDNVGREMTFQQFRGHPDMNIGMCSGMIDHLNDQKKIRATPATLDQA